MRPHRRRMSPAGRSQAVAGSWSLRLFDLRQRRLGRRIEGLRQSPLLVVIARAIPKARPADTGGAMASDQFAVGVLAQQIVEEQVLRYDDVALETQDLGDVGNAAAAVA